MRQLVEKSKDENEVVAPELPLTSMYVDDILGAVDSIQQALRIPSNISKIIENLGKRVTKFALNSSKV